MAYSLSLCQEQKSWKELIENSANGILTKNSEEMLQNFECELQSQDRNWEKEGLSI